MNHETKSLSCSTIQTLFLVRMCEDDEKKTDKNFENKISLALFLDFWAEFREILRFELIFHHFSREIRNFKLFGDLWGFLGILENFGIFLELLKFLGGFLGFS